MEKIEQAFDNILPTWKQVHKRESEALYSKGELRIKLIHYKGESQSSVSRMGQTFFKVRKNSHEEALLSVKKYLDKAFPGMN